MKGKGAFVDRPHPPGAKGRAWTLWLGLVVVGAALHVPLLIERERPLSRGELQLVEQAERVLRRGGDKGFDYGRFFVQAEGAAGTSIEHRWQSIAAAVKETAQPYGGPRLETGVSNLMLVLFRDAHLARYRREEAGLSGFLFDRNAGGNCEAQTKLLVAAMRASEMALPEGTELGVEVFQDHAQAVLVRRRDRTVWNLLTGVQEGAPRGEVYRPAILLSAYLRGLGRVPPIADSALLLLRAPRPPHLAGVAGPAPSFYTSSTLRLPASRVRFAEGMPPESTEVPFPLLRKESDANNAAAMDKDITFREAFVSGNDPRLLFPIDRVDGSFGLVGTTLVFRRREDADAYQAAKTPEARRAYLLDLAEKQLRQELAGEALELPPMPKLARLPLADLDKLLARLQRVEWLLGLTEQAVDRTQRSPMVTAALELRLPALSRTTRSLRQFSEDAGSEPEAFFGRLGSFDPVSRRRLIGFFVPRLQSAHVRALASALAEPGRVALSARQDAPPPNAPAPIVFTEMDVDLLPSLAPSSSAQPSPDARPGSAARSSDPPPSPKAPVDPFAVPPSDVVEPLPVPAFLDLVLSGLFSSGTGEEAMPVLRRWDRATSDTLVHVLMQRGADCDDALARLRHSVIRPFEETKQRPPSHLVDAEKKIADHCAKLASLHPPTRAAPPKLG